MSEDEIIKFIKREIEIDIDTRNSFKNDKESPVYKDLDEYIKAHQGLLGLYKKEKERAEELLKDREKSTEEYIHNNPWLYKQLAESYILKLDVKKDYISKDKIKGKIEYLDNQQRQWLEDRELKNSDEEICFARDFLIKLLKEEN